MLTLLGIVHKFHTTQQTNFPFQDNSSTTESNKKPITEKPSIQDNKVLYKFVTER